VNNAKYGDYALDALKTTEPLNIKEFQIDFHKEILFDTVTDIFVEQSENAVLLKGVQNDEYMFLVKIEREF
jgi:hypothetical protein